MDDTDVSTDRQNGAFGGSRIACATIAVILLAACKPKPPDGFWVTCDSNTKNTYYKWDPGTGVYKQIEAKDLQKCYGKDEWLAMDTANGETGEAEDTEGIYRAGWPTHEPSLAYIRTRCTNRCIDLHNEKSGEAYTCDPENWIIKGYYFTGWNLLKKALATVLEDPGDLNCRVESNQWKSAPATSIVVQANSAAWPSDNSAIALACSTVRSCAKLFDENILAYLVTETMAPPGNDEAEADYLVTSSVISSSTLTLGIANPNEPSQDSNWVGGRAEYTALDCGEPACPLYLGNLTIENTSDTWNLYSEAMGAHIEVTNLNARLSGPTLGVWRPSTGEVYFDDQMLEMRADFDLSIAGEPTAGMTEYVANAGGLFGILQGNNAIQFPNFSMSGGELEGSATLDYDSVDGSPPVASFTLPPTVVLGQLELGLLISSIAEHSTDPDGDPDWKLWLIDGHQVAPDYVIPPGLHTIRLEVRDSRFAFDDQEQLVMITHEEQE